jgi:acetoin utilization protein AcuB
VNGSALTWVAELLRHRDMKKAMATHLYAIDHYMTPSPHVVHPAASLASAKHLMHELGARHLPVLEDGKLVGMLSERDVLSLESLTVADPNRIPVQRAMQTDVYGVERETSLEEVATTMAKHKYGSAVVMSGAAVVGIFTSVDAMRALAELVRRDTHQ